MQLRVGVRAREYACGRGSLGVGLGEADAHGVEIRDETSDRPDEAWHSDRPNHPHSTPALETSEPPQRNLLQRDDIRSVETREMERYFQLVTAVREGNPNRKEPKESDHIELVSMTIQPGQEIIVGQRLREILSAAQKGKSAA